MKLKNISSVFNMGDTSFRRKTLLQDYKELLPLLIEHKIQYPIWEKNNKSQEVFFRTVLEKTEFFDGETNLSDLAKRGRTLTNALIKPGLINDKREISEVALHWVNNKTKEPDNLEKLMNLSLDNLIFLRQWFKLRVYEPEGEEYFYPFRVALRFLTKYNDMQEYHLLVILHLLSPSFDNEKIKKALTPKIDLNLVEKDSEQISFFDNEINKIVLPDGIASLKAGIFYLMKYHDEKSKYTNELVEFLYDGSLEGLFTAIFYAYQSKDPCTINKLENHIPSLLNEIKEITTELDKFKRVYNSIIQKLNGKALNNIYYLYLSEIEGAEDLILNYLKLCYKYGTDINLAKNNDTIISVDKYYRKVSGEAHMFTGFVRFKEIAPLSFYAQIEPVYNILPIIINHFTLRFSDQNFIIHDLKREKAIIYNKKTAIITDLSKDEGYLISTLNNDTNFESLWKTFYKSVNIKERENSKLQKQHMPKRYWNHLTEI